MALRFENWSNNLLKLTMKKKYEEAGLVFPPEGSPFLLKVFLEPPYEDSARDLKIFMQEHQIPETYLDTTRVGRRGKMILHVFISICMATSYMTKTGHSCGLKKK